MFHSISSKIFIWFGLSSQKLISQTISLLIWYNLHRDILRGSEPWAEPGRESGKTRPFEEPFYVALTKSVENHQQNIYN